MQQPLRLPALTATLIASLTLGGCFNKISGTFKDSNNVLSLDFNGKGTVYAKIVGIPVMGSYEEKDNKIIIKGPEGDMFIDVVDANTLSASHPLSTLTGELTLKRQ